MSQFWQGVLFMVGTTAFIAAALLFVSMVKNARLRDAEIQLTEQQVPEKVVKPMPIDPDNPPSWKEYRPKVDSPVRHCICHPDRVLQVGQSVLWWPVPHSGGVVNLFCEDGIEVPE